LCDRRTIFSKSRKVVQFITHTGDIDEHWP
jgi:hypothetical protein